jgi:serine/threonine-protein kinase
MRTRLGGHDLMAHLGDGGMGTVWLARRPAPDMDRVAIKTIKPENAADVRIRKLFEREMRLAAAIRHPNVARVLSSGEDVDGTPYLVMEYVDGHSLRALGGWAVSQGGIPLGIALRIVHDVCVGLHAAHELVSIEGHSLGVVHRDVSPQNVLISRDGVAKVIDFGVAKVRGAITGDSSSSGGLKGKVRYMAPEQALGREVDRRADVFAAGAILYELVVGEPPFAASNDLAILGALVSRAPVPIPDGVARPVAAVLERALAKAPAKRYSDAEAMRSALAEAMEALGQRATTQEVGALVRRMPGAPAAAVTLDVGRSDATTQTMKPTGTRRRLAAIAAGVLVLALVPILGGASGSFARAASTSR